MDWNAFVAENGTAFFWLGVAASATIVEGMTWGLVSIWFVPGALLAMVLSFFVESVGVQIGVFLLTSVLCLVLTKTVFKKYLPQNRKKNQMNADSLIGAHGVVKEEINNLHETGCVRIKGLDWTARSADDDEIIPQGSVVTVCEISGVKLICRVRQDHTEG